MKSEDWREQASCRGMDVSVFVPSTGKRGRPVANEYKKARAICEQCKVKISCLNFALTSGFNEFGIFGGLSPKARQILLRKRKAEA